MANPDLGAKQICPHCQAKFYDLNKRPAHCPKCATEFDPDEAIRNRRVRARTAAPEIEPDDEREDQVKEAADGEEEEEDTSAPELDEVADETPIGDDEDEDGEPTPPVSEDLGEFTDEDEVDEADDVPFLEEDDDDDFDDSEIDGINGGDDE